MKWGHQMRGRFLLLVSILLLLLMCGTSHRMQVVESRQGRFITSNYTFLYEHWTQPKIRKLFVQENLEKFVKEYPEEWHRQVALCNWTNAQWPPGNPDPYPLSNGLDILADIRSGKTKGFCGQYAYLFADALKALGYFHVRYVELESKSHGFHFNAEVWSDRWQKWIVLDPFFNVYYTNVDGVPLSALELHVLSVSAKSKDARVNVIERRGYQPPPRDSVDFYYSLAFSLRNDLAGLPAPLTVQDRLLMFLQYVDPAMEGWQPRLVYANRSSRMEDFEYTCNQLALRYSLDQANHRVRCEFETRGTIPHFRTFVVSVDGGTWQESSAIYDWKLKKGENTLVVRGLNQFNIPSAAASLTVELKK